MSRRNTGTMLPLNTVAPPVHETAETTAQAVPAAGFWRSHGPALAARRYELVPLRRGTKIPAKLGWRRDTYKTTDKALLRGFRGCGVGVKTGKLVAIDIDCDDPEVVEQHVTWCEENLGPGLRRDGSRGTMLFYRTSEPGQKVTSHAYMATGRERPQRLEVLGVGQQAGVYVERLDSGQPYYSYPGGELTDRPLNELTEISKAQRYEAADYFESLARAAGWAQMQHGADRDGGAEHRAGKDPHAELWELEGMLAVIPTPPGWKEWNRVAMALFRATDGSEEGFKLFDEWSQRGVGYDYGGPARERWEALDGCPPNSIGAGTLRHMANEADRGWRARAEAARDIADPSWRERKRDENDQRLRRGLERLRHGRAAENTHGDDQTEPRISQLTTWLASGIVPAELPRREFLLGGTYARTFVGSTFAEGGTGKTSLAVAQALAMASGRPLTGEKVHQRCRALLICFEDNADELNRRVSAAMIHHKIAPADIEDRLHLSVLTRADGKLMVIDRETRQPVLGELAPSLEALIVELQADVVILDPLKKLHGVEENSNDHMDAVAQVLTDMASKLNIAISVPHHMTKGAAEPGNADRGRGASALKDALRLGFTMARMSPAEAARFGVPEEERGAYTRVDTAKVNIVPQARSAQWFRLVNVEIGNGDSVQAIEPWQPPELMSGLDGEAVERVLAEIGKGTDNGERYSNAASAKSRCVSRAFERAGVPKPPTDARLIVADWIKKGMVQVANYHSPQTRRQLGGLYVAGYGAEVQGVADVQSSAGKSAQ